MQKFLNKPKIEYLIKTIELNKNIIVQSQQANIILTQQASMYPQLLTQCKYLFKLLKNVENIKQTKNRAVDMETKEKHKENQDLSQQQKLLIKSIVYLFYLTKQAEHIFAVDLRIIITKNRQSRGKQLFLRYLQKEQISRKNS